MKFCMDSHKDGVADIAVLINADHDVHDEVSLSCIVSPAMVLGPEETKRAHREVENLNQGDLPLLRNELSTAVPSRPFEGLPKSTPPRCGG